METQNYRKFVFPSFLKLGLGLVCELVGPSPSTRELGLEGGVPPQISRYAQHHSEVYLFHGEYELGRPQKVCRGYSTGLSPFGHSAVQSHGAAIVHSNYVIFGGSADPPAH